MLRLDLAIFALLVPESLVHSFQFWQSPLVVVFCCSLLETLGTNLEQIKTLFFKLENKWNKTE